MQDGRRRPGKPPSLVAVYHGLKTLSPFLRSKSNKNIVVNPTIVGLLADPLAKVGEKMHQVAPGTYEEVVERFKAARQGVLDTHDNISAEDHVPQVGLVKDLLPPVAPAAAASTTWTLNDILNEIEVEKKVLAQQKHVLLAQTGQQLQKLVLPAGMQQLKACEAALEGAGVSADLIHAIVTNTVSMAHVPVLTKLLTTHPEVEAVIQTVQSHHAGAAESRDDGKKGRKASPLRREKREKLRLDDRDASRLYDVPLSILKGLAKASPRGDKVDLVASLTALANQIVDEKVDEIKLSLVEASNASHALYTAITFILLAVMFGALSLFLLSLWFTQFLNVYLSLSYLLALITASASAVFLGILFGYVGSRIVKNTMKSLQVILLSPQPARPPTTAPSPTADRAPTDARETSSFPGLGSLDKLGALLAKKARPPSAAAPPEALNHPLHETEDVKMVEMHRPIQMEHIPEESSAEGEPTSHRGTAAPPTVTHAAEDAESSGEVLLPSPCVNDDKDIAAPIDQSQVDLVVVDDSATQLHDPLEESPVERPTGQDRPAATCGCDPLPLETRSNRRRLQRDRSPRVGCAQGKVCGSRNWRQRRRRWKAADCMSRKDLTWTRRGKLRHVSQWHEDVVTGARSDCVRMALKQATPSTCAGAHSIVRRRRSRSRAASPTSKDYTRVRQMCAVRTAATDFVARVLDEAAAAVTLHTQCCNLAQQLAG